MRIRLPRPHCCGGVESARHAGIEIQWIACHASFSLSRVILTRISIETFFASFLKSKRSARTIDRRNNARTCTPATLTYSSRGMPWKGVGRFWETLCLRLDFFFHGKGASTLSQALLERSPLPHPNEADLGKHHKQPEEQFHGLVYCRQSRCITTPGNVNFVWNTYVYT